MNRSARITIQALKSVIAFANRLDDLKLQQEEILLKLNKQIPPTPLEYSEGFSSPMKTLEELHEFNDKLKDRDFALKYHELIKQIGGSGNRDHVNGILKNIIDDDLGEKCAWTGARNNTQISNMYFIITMYSTLRTIYTTYTQKEFKADVMEWFRHCKQRNERRKKREITDNANLV